MTRQIQYDDMGALLSQQVDDVVPGATAGADSVHEQQHRPIAVDLPVGDLLAVQNNPLRQHAISCTRW